MASVLGTLAAASFCRGDLVATVELCGRAERISDLNGGVAWIDPTIAILHLALALAHNDHDRIERLVEQYAVSMDDSPVYRQHAGSAAHALARSLVRRGRSDVVAERTRFLLQACAEVYVPWAEVDAAMVAGMTAVARGEIAAARRAYERAVDQHDALRLFILHGFPRLELAGLCVVAGDEHGARNQARPTLEWLADLDAPGVLLPDGGVHRPVLELFGADGRLGQFVQQALGQGTTGPATGPVRVSTTGETLSAREREVLRLVADGLANRQIGEQLFISERTVKSHMTAVLRKLDATNRTRAVLIARQLGLV